MTKYQYTPLDIPDAIRLIRLKPGESGAPLLSTIVVASLSDETQYCALSYAWGSDKKPHVLDTDDGCVSVTESLRSALNRLRSSTDDIMIWADAVCINQDDNQEKSLQVRKMREIYEKATLVLVYLGEEAENSHLAKGLFEVLGLTDWCTRFGLEPLQNFDTTLIVRGIADPFPPFEDPAWEAARAVLRRSWFRRAWIVQEFAVGKEVEMICGEWKLPWQILAQAIRHCRDHKLSFISAGLNYDKETAIATELGETSMRQLSSIRGRFLGPDKEALKLQNLLREFRHTLATRSRDHLFALLGLASDAKDVEFDADYCEPFENIVRRYGAEFYRRGSGAAMLSDAGIGTQPSRFPSWIPDWTMIHNRLTAIDTGCTIYSASNRSKFQSSVTTDNSVLKISGIIFDTITSTGQSHIEHPDSVSTHNPLKPMIDRHDEARKLFSSIQVYPTGEDPKTAFWRTLITNKQDLTHEAPDSFAELYPLAIEVFHRKHARTGTFDLDGKIFRKAWPYIEWLLKSFEYMRFCVTEKGYIGLCAESTEPGDVVAIVDGMNTPYVLRKEKDDPRDGHFRLVGQCYVHGIMKGEAHDQAATGDLFLW